MEEKRKRRKKKLTPAESREQMAQAGDVDGLLQLLATSSPAAIDWEATFGLLVRAVDVCSRQDPGKFAADIFSRMVGFIGYLLLRAQLYASKMITAYDRSGRGHGSGELPRELTELVLPRLMELQQHLAGLASSQASTARLWGLARRKQGANERGEEVNRQTTALGLPRLGDSEAAQETDRVRPGTTNA